MNYYYLIAGLPNLSNDMDSQGIDFEKTFELIQRNLTLEDNRLFRYLLYPNDIRNLLSILFYEYHHLPLLSAKRTSVFSEEEMKDYRFFRSNFPNFLNDFLAENEARFPSMTMREMEDALMAKFYEEVVALNNLFIRKYFSFYKELKDLIAAFNFESFKFLSSPNIKDPERLIGQIGPARSPTTTLIKDYPYLEKLMAVLSDNDPQKIALFIDRILWDFLEEKKQGFFSNEEVFTYTIQLLMKERWALLDREEGSKRFLKIHQKIRNNVRSPKASII
ncbi:DUF2764 family protein [Flexithrix dorotheae]|uniref:DUF2764 family protein n=1 Tax=Flexithrix dorotheae TaxID=70993 RepID=UPI00035D161B|nr:DUF2764 family protein [Flexithrix dorotheae]